MDAAMEDRDSATYSIESEPSQPTSGKNISIDDVILPTVRRSAIQIVSQPISPRRQLKKPSTASATGTMQITKLVLKTPPGSPKRQPKVPGIIIRSIQTVGGPGLIGCVDHQDHATVKQKPSVLMDNGQNVHDETVPYRIVPIVDPKSIRKDFEARRAERERSSNEFQDFLRESFKENKTPPSTPPPPPVLATSKAVEITHNSAMTSSGSESKSHVHNVTKSSCVKPDPMEVVPQINPPAKEDQSVQQPLNVSPPVPAARRSLLVATEIPPDVVQKPATLALADISKEPVIFIPPPLPENLESQANVEPMEPPRKSVPIRQRKQLVSKSVQNARTRSQSCAPKVEECARKDTAPSEHQRTRPSTARPAVTNLRKFSSTPSLKLIKHPAADGTKQNNPLKPLNSASDGPVHAPRKPQRSIVNTPSGPASTSSDKLPSTVGSKIGILRKPDDLALEDIVPFSPLKRDSLSQPSSVKLKPTQQGPSSSMVNAQLIVINAEKYDDQSIAEAEKELKLDVPNVSLVPSSAASQIPDKLPVANPVEDHAPEPIKTIPSWLKQSLRQPDPYPFIVAVRKKLEAVRNVRDEEGDNKRTAEVQGKDTNVETPIRNAKSHTYLDAIESVPFIRKAEQPNNKAVVPSRQRQASDVVMDGSIIMTNISSYASSNTTSEISSIKSDIPPPMPPLLCSTRVEVPNQITIKSLSPRAASSGPISPLSVERISQMNIANPQPTASRLPRPIDREREADSSIQHGSRKNESLASPRINSANNNRVSEPNDRSLKELEYQRLLESFNRSLTHVIEVNQQLYSALKNVPAPAAVPQEILRIRDEMTQTSQPVMVIPKEAVQEAQNPRDQVPKLIEPAASRAGGSTTTASNYSDDFEHQSQTVDAPGTPERKASLHSVGSPATSSTESSGSSSSSSSSDHGSSSESSESRTSDNSSSSSASSSSNEGIGPHNAQSERHHQMADQASTTGERKKTRTASNTTTAHSSDFDSRSFSLSDSHNNTRNNHPPMPDEYLPSFEESLRRSKQAPVSDELDKRHPRAQETSRDGTSTISERIDRTNEERSFSLRHSEEANDLPVKAASLPLATDTDDTSFDRSTLKGESGSKGQCTNAADTTINSELLAAMFNRTDLEVSILSATVSETNLSYSSIGMFDQMINGEKSREEQLVSRVQAKQKALLNRAKGQLAWLELQKQRYREKGMTEHISAIKKKQRAILLRLEKDRAELNRTIKNSTDSSATTTARTPLTAKNVDSKLSSYCSSPTGNTVGSLTLRKTSSSIRSGHRQPRTPETPHHQRQRRTVAGSTVTATTTTTTSNSIQIAIRGRELEPNDRLEDILLRREAELRKRKEHVQRLLQWHRKLEREEEELLAVEGKLLAYNSRKLEENTAAPKADDPTIEARVRSIERSLKTLQSIPASVSGGASVNGSIEHGDEGVEEVVKMGGSKLNRLWYRLTGIKEQRYEPGRNYPITRPHLEALYEQAKRCVLEGFQRNEGRLEEGLFEQSIGAGEMRSNSELGETNTTTMSAESVVGGSLSQHTMIESEKTVPTVEERKETPDGAVDMETQQISEPSEQEESSKTDPLELHGGNDDRGYMLLSSTVVNGWSPESRRSIESVEFHTLEETGTHSQSIPEATTSIEEEPPGRSESYSMTFEEHSVIGRSNDPDASDGPGLVVGEESQPMIEDMSLPSALLNNTSGWLNETEETASSSSCESSITVELSVPLVERKDGDEGSSAKNIKEEIIASDGSDSIVQSLEEASDSTGATVTPTSMSVEAIDENIPKVHEENVDASDGKGNQKESMGEMMISPVEQPTVDDTEDVGSDFEVEEEDIFQLRSSRVSSRTDSPSSCASELEKRLATLQDELEELSETFERTPLMKSPTMPKTKPERTTSTSEDETNTFVDEGSSVSGTKEKESSSSVAVVVANLTTTLTPVDPPSVVKMEVKVLPKASSSFVDGSMGIPSASAVTSNRDYPAVSPHQGYTPTAGEAPLSPPAVVRMPDIINEAEVLRRQQLQIEQEIKELEQQVGFFREIPNKPPPPYIPPANGSPLALLFPTEARINELIDGRVEELHRDRIPPERLRSDHVTNVYEKLILDMCKELYRELRPADPTVSFRTITHDKRPLVFYNPPDALRCMKDYLRAKVRRILNEEQLALQQQHQHQHHQHQQLLLHHHQLQQQQQQQQQQPQQPHVQLQQHHQLLHHCATMPFLFANGGNASRRKRDQVDEILAQEMHDDDARWTNFDREEIEVKDRITDVLLKSLLTEALHDMAEAYRCKAKGGGKVMAVVPQESAM
ncbi:centrosome-associated protein 350-like [Anopheles ziemanni]|uniref:centrosome-associated protein 350-like n=1 Tax=Anopheles coustani TaxID=139045 RepID=UPI002659879A|nr:centrosome-associated protein 350-like [Anopheles coustani]XP_058177414.1 centrosome-associated protein 350-like [Anopheles ziemanni]